MKRERDSDNGELPEPPDQREVLKPAVFPVVDFGPTYEVPPVGAPPPPKLRLDQAQYTLYTDLVKLRIARDILQTVTVDITEGRVPMEEYRAVVKLVRTWIDRHEKVIAP